MLNVIANSLMIASRTPSAEYQHPEATRLAENETARAKRSREIAAFLDAARESADLHMNA